ncbi:MAG: hypothetical protein SVR04_00250 [Spirochaetota bacterium]|nr:hypothetical protein [Spirochaetota bacterium]
MENIILTAGILVLYIAYVVFVITLIRRPKVFEYDVFAHNGRWLDTVAAFSKREVERLYAGREVYVKKHL